MAEINISFQTRHYIVVEYDNKEVLLDYTVPGGTMFSLPDPPSVMAQTVEIKKSRTPMVVIPKEVMDESRTKDDRWEKEKIIFQEVYKEALRVVEDLKRRNPDWKVNDYAKTQLEGKSE